MPARQEAALPRRPLRRAPAPRPGARRRDVPGAEVAAALRAQGRQEGRPAVAPGRRRTWSRQEAEGRVDRPLQRQAGEEGPEGQGGAAQQAGQVG